jgi:hypothetical protein
MQVSGEMLQELCLGVVVQGDEDLLGRLATTSKKAGELLASMIKDSSSPLPEHVHQVRTYASILLRPSTSSTSNLTRTRSVHRSSSC